MDFLGAVVPFVRVAEERHFRRAAARLGVTPAAVSKAVARLEAELGVTLLDRTSRQVSLTREGALFFEHCRVALEQLRTGRERVSASQRLAQGPVRLTLSPVLARRVLPALAGLYERYPGLSFELSVTDRLSRLADEEIDLALRIGELEDSSLVSRLLARPRWMTLASPAYLARRGTPDSPAALSGCDALRFRTTRGRPQVWVFAERGAALPAPPVTDRLLVDNGELLVDAALAGLGVCQVFDFLALEHVREGRLVELLPDFAADAPAVHAVWLPRRQVAPKVRLALEALEQLFRSLRQDPRREPRSPPV